MMIGEYRPNYEADGLDLTYWRALLGRESGVDGAALVAASPSRNAAKLTVPVMLIHGRNDNIVLYEQSLKMKNEMEVVGKSVELVTLDGDDHHISTAASRQATLTALDRFLAQHNPAK